MKEMSTLTFPNKSEPYEIVDAAARSDIEDLKNNPYTHPAHTARTGVPANNQTPAFGGTFNVTQPVSDTSGHITAMNSRTITIPNNTATTSADGLMSSSDKTKLNAYGPTSIIVHNSTTSLPAVVPGALLVCYDA